MPQSPKRPAYRAPRPAATATAASARTAWTEPTPAASADRTALDRALHRAIAVAAETRLLRHALQSEGKTLRYAERVQTAEPSWSGPSGEAETIGYRLSYVGDASGPPGAESVPVEFVRHPSPYRFGHADRKRRLRIDSPEWADLLSQAGIPRSAA